MKRFLLQLPLLLLACLSIAQDITMTFNPRNSEEGIDSVVVLNQRSGQIVKLSGNESLVLKYVTTGLDLIHENNGNGFLYPNPADGFSFLQYSSSKEGNLAIEMYNLAGHLLGSYRQSLPGGNHRFRITFPASGMYIVSVKDGHETCNFKAICNGNIRQPAQISYQGSSGETGQGSIIRKSLTGDLSIDYAEGDILQITLYSGDMITVVTDSPETTREIVVDFYPCTDPGNRNYKTVKIGEQVWMAENLAYLPSVNGSSHGSIVDPCYYVWGYPGTDVDEAKAWETYQMYGVLYSWPAAMAGAGSSSSNPSNVQGICPGGWHLPSDAEWTQLENYLADNGHNYDGTSGGGGNKIARSLAADTYWLTPATNVGAVGDNLSLNNKSGFSALPGGYRSFKGWGGDGGQGYWWTSTQIYSQNAKLRSMNFNTTDISGGNEAMYFGFSVRCVKDN
jgi:uncharacterized protein (TIGR02145 family)